MMRAARTLGLISILAALSYGAFVIYQRSPPNTFNLFCTYDFAYRLNVTIEVDGQQYTSEVIRQLSRSRPWVKELNRDGCKPTIGTASSFRLANNRLVLVSSKICADAIKAFEDPRHPGDFVG